MTYHANLGLDRNRRAMRVGLWRARFEGFRRRRRPCGGRIRRERLIGTLAHQIATGTLKKNATNYIKIAITFKGT